MAYHKIFRQCIQKNNNELLIFGAGNFSQFPRRDASVRSKCDRALAIACKEDLVVLRTSLGLDHEYQDRLQKLLGQIFSEHLNLQQ
ncbi:MAG: hypothetical protein KAJ62_08780 [Desulfobacteraceae bacterium]|nr:hypothetical protein [Desulfobacteraceae bacterium]